MVNQVILSDEASGFAFPKTADSESGAPESEASESEASESEASRISPLADTDCMS